MHICVQKASVNHNDGDNSGITIIIILKIIILKIID